MKPKNRAIVGCVFLSAIYLLSSVSEATHLNSIKTQNAETPLLRFRGKQTKDTVFFGALTVTTANLSLVHRPKAGGRRAYSRRAIVRQQSAQSNVLCCCFRLRNEQLTARHRAYVRCLSIGKGIVEFRPCVMRRNWFIGAVQQKPCTKNAIERRSVENAIPCLVCMSYS